MDLQTHQSLMFDTTILENGIIQIPELTNWQKKDVHIVVVLKEQLKFEYENDISLAGRLKSYANPNLIENETDLAWANIKDN